ncbi:maltotransferase domain-containing protein [Rhizobacter sp. LjRoot28]|uniref:maltotransferase domain-containing protein n=1 Tax=Rhizobacter sp. LjRoot28 TaxID=3342309 RepID=UPI003ECC7231
MNRNPTAEPRLPEHGRIRAVIDAVLPVVDGGRFAVKCVAGEPFEVTAHCFTDGHDLVRVRLQWGADGDEQPTEVEMVATGNDEWRGCFVPLAPGRYHYRVAAWVDSVRSWRHELVRRVDPEDIRVAALTGASLLAATARRATRREDAEQLDAWVTRLRTQAAARASDPVALKALALDENLAAVADRYPDRSLQTVHPVALPLVADRPRARFSAWYELFPRSASSQPGRHGTLRDVEARLPYVADMGFDVLYLPPIHPIGRERRKGRNNTLVALEGDVGSPWAIGAREGGHVAILPELGTAEDFRRLVASARKLDIDLAMDIAFQCAPDHPWVKEHPGWFRHRPDGSVQYAENPPKKYQDIYPFDFECDDWQGLWQALKGVFEHWIGEGVTVFRVDNPHTKAFPFWEWVIGEINRAHPEVLFLAEAFTRPKVMHRLAKLGFSQSYTYFTWRNTREELTEYFTELAHGPGRSYFRPNVWPNTPDILNEHLHGANRATFAMRFVLAGLLCSSYGIYGPAYELLENRPREAGSEEYLDSEKYQLRHWDLDRPDSLRPLITRVNQIRRAHPALHDNAGLQFHPADNGEFLVWSKQTADADDTVLVIANLDPHNVQSGWVDLDLDALGIPQDAAYQVRDVLNGDSYTWRGARNFVILDPARTPAHVFHVTPHARSEQDFKDFV